jgi:hypothetical protein
MKPSKALEIKRKRMDKLIYILFLFLILSHRAKAQSDSITNLESEWKEISGSVDYEKNNDVQKPYSRGYVPPSLPEYGSQELETSDMIYDDIDREELYQKRLVVDREGQPGDAPVKKKIKDISKPREVAEWDQIDFQPRVRDLPDFDPNIDFLKLLLLLIAIVIIAYLIYQLVLKRIRLPEEKKTSSLSQDVDLLNPEAHEEEELQQQLQNHLAKQEFRNVLRIHYLMILKELIQKGMIKWKKDKTNYHYQNELTGTAHFEDFHYTLYVFEKAWYGLHELSHSDYERIRPRIDKLMSNLRNE